MRPAPDPPMIILLAICLYVAIIAIGFAGAALGHGLMDQLLTMVGLESLVAK